MAERQRRQGFSYRVDSHFALSVQGRWATGGAAQVSFDGELVAELNLSPGLFGLLALLIEAGQAAAVQGQPAAAFVPAKALAVALDKLVGVGQSDPLQLHKLVHKLRGRFVGTALAQFADRNRLHWDREVIERHPTLGYRLSLSPANLRLDLLP